MSSSTARSFVLRGANVHTSIQSCEWTSRGLRIGGVEVRIVDVRSGVTTTNAAELTRFATLTTPEGTFTIGMSPDVQVELSLTAPYQGEAESSVTSEQPSDGITTPPSRVTEVTPATLEKAALAMDKLCDISSQPPTVEEVAIMADKEVMMVNQSADPDKLNRKLTVEFVRRMKNRLIDMNLYMTDKAYGFRNGFAEFTEPFIDVFTKKVGALECIPEVTCNHCALTLMAFVRHYHDYGTGGTCIEVYVYFMKSDEVVKKYSASWPITYEGEKVTTFRLFDINMLRHELCKCTQPYMVSVEHLKVGEGKWIKQSVLSPDVSKPESLDYAARNVATILSDYMTDERSILGDGITIADYLTNSKYDRITPHEMFIRVKPSRKRTSKRNSKPKRGSPGA